MDRETVIALAKEAGLLIQEGAQDRLLYDTPIVEALAKFAELAHGGNTTLRVSIGDSPKFLEVTVPDDCARAVNEAIKCAFNNGVEFAKAQIVTMLTTSP